MNESVTNDPTLIRLHNVKKVFLAEEVETHALSNINMEIRRGEYVAISGPSGCGKSTLLSILGLLDTPSEGEHFLKDEPVENLSASQRARVRNREIGFIFQAFNLIGDLNVYENVELPLTYRGMPSKERKERVKKRSRASGDGAPDEALSVAALGRPATARGGGAGAGGRPGDPAGG